IAYVVFLCFFTHLVLVKMDPLIPTWQEIYVTVFLFSFKCDKIRELLSSEPTKMSQKLAVWFENRWNICDFIGVSCFFLGTCFRFTPQYFRVGRVIYCVDIIYWYVRLLDILSVNKYLGPFVTMIGKMVVNMAYFVILLAVVLLSFGVARQSILNPDHEFEFSLVKAVLYQPYFMLYGEVSALKVRQLRGSNMNCVVAHANVQAFRRKLALSQRWIEVGNLANFPLLDTELQQKEGDLSQELRDQIKRHLHELTEAFKTYFGDPQHDWTVVDPFRVELDAVADDDEGKDELVDLQNNAEHEVIFREDAIRFWCSFRSEACRSSE
ncbi:unnamed protein product, partial [Cyprideis torosa]